MKKYILNKINNFKAVKKQQQEKTRDEVRLFVMDEINRSWSKEEIFAYNCELLINSTGLVGGNYTEESIKLHLLAIYRKYFTEEELNTLEDTINYPNETKIKKLTK